MDLFTLAAPVFDLAMKISGHHKTMIKLGNMVKKEELKRHSSGSQNQLNLSQSSAAAKQAVKLLDLGGGTGELINYLPRNLEITVADPSEAMLAKGRNKNFEQQVKHILADGADLPFANNSFDYLIISDALHHFRQVKTALVEAERVMKPVAKIFILEFDPRTILTKIIICLEKLAGEPVNFYQPEKLAEMMTGNSLQPQYEYLNKSLYIVCAEKQ